MSLFRLPRLRTIASKFENVRDGVYRKGGRGTGRSKPRRLVIDPLEERQLLSLTPADVGDTLVNQTVDENSQYTLSAQSIATDNDGDFVVTWTRYDPVLDTGGSPVIDPESGLPMTDANIYARYFTDEVQRLTLPDAIAVDNVPGVYGQFTLSYGANEIQKLTITATNQPFTFWQSNIAVDFKIGFDLNGDTSINPITEKTQTIFFDETDTLAASALQIQTELQGLGGALSDVTVEAINPHEFLVKFGTNSGGLNQPEMVIDPLDVSTNTGFLPSVRVSTVREPINIGPIIVSPDDGALTATSIQQAFSQTADTLYIGPIDFPPPNRVPSSWEGPYRAPQSMRVALPGVTVTPVQEVDPITNQWRDSLTQFDITFDGLVAAKEGASGKKDHPELVVVSGQDDMLNPLPVGDFDVTTLKEPSKEFRVNPEEPDNPFTTLPDKFHQTNPAVAMDVDGEFVITWQSEVPDWVNFGSVSDVFARRFRAVGLVAPADVEFYVDSDLDGVAEDPIQGVRALVTPEVEYVELLTFDVNVPPASLPLTGPFRIWFDLDGDSILDVDAQGDPIEPVTDEIQFDSNNPDAVAAGIESELFDLGSREDEFDLHFRDVTVAVVSDVDPYQFEVRFKNTFEAPTGADDARSWLTIHFDSATLVPPDLTVTVADQSPADLLTFRVNPDTTNAQGEPAVGMDSDGNFVIAWANGGQDISFFNSIHALRYDRYGEPLDDEFLVNVENTNVHFEPFVALSADGHFVITWTTTSDPRVIPPPRPIVSAIQAVLYDVDGTTLVPQFGPGGAARSSAAFDLNNNFVIAWDEFSDADNIGITSEGVYAIMYDVTGTAIRSEFRANSASFTPADATLWPLWQGSAQAALDADGDLVITYDGYGPDVSETVDMAGAYFAEQINSQKNADLLPFFDPVFEDLANFFTGHPADRVAAQPGLEGSAYNGTGMFFYGSNADVDGAIDEILYRLTSLVFPPTDEQVGRLRSILDEVAGLLRGEANGVMFTRWDADPNLGPINILFSDSVANAYRDGNNHRELIVLDGDLEWDSFVIRLSHPNRGGYEDLGVTVARTAQNVFLPNDTTRAIADALEAAERTGINWPESNVYGYEGPIDVRLLSPDEIITRQLAVLDDGFTRPWDLSWFGVNSNDWVWEVTFQGEVHDIPMWMSLREGELVGDEVQTITFTANIPTPLPPGLRPFYLNLGTTQGTNPIYFDPNNVAGVATSIENEVETLLGTGGVQVTVFENPGPPHTWTFTITLAGASGGSDEDQLSVRIPVDAFGIPLWSDASPSWATLADGGEPDAPGGSYFSIVHTYGDGGTQQYNASIGMEPDGDFVLAWTQGEQYTSGAVSNNNIYVRRFTEDTDTAGPRVTDLVAPNGAPVESGGLIEAPVTHLVLAFDEDMMSIGDDSVTNPDNYRLLMNQVEIPGAILGVQYGMNRAADLAGQIDPLSGLAYNVNPVPSNKWEAILTLDGNGLDPGIIPLETGYYTIEVIAPVDPTPTQPGQSGLRDAAGNPIGHTGFQVGGQGDSRDFSVFDTDAAVPGTETDGTRITHFVDYGRTYLENRGAVGVDGDGDHVVVYTRNVGGVDRLYMQRFGPNGLALGLATAVTPGLLPGDAQRLGSVAVDADGDYVITWTNYDAATNDANIYARRFHADGGPRTDGPTGTNPFLVNQYTANNQKWSNVAMDVDGDFVVTWSSYGQEDNNQLGKSYGVYARRYDSFGQPLAPEFRANVMTSGNQRHSNVAMDAAGGFVIVWTSDQNGVGDDIIARTYWPDGSPQDDVTQGPLFGEILVNANVNGNQTHPDVAMQFDGSKFVVTWTGQDPSGTGVYHRQFNRLTSRTQTFRTQYTTDIVAPGEPSDPADNFLVPLQNNPFFSTTVINDLDVFIDIQHPQIDALTISVIRSPVAIIPANGFNVTARSPNFTRPLSYDIWGPNWLPAAAVNVDMAIMLPGGPGAPPSPGTGSYSGTIFDDEAGVAINGPGVVPSAGQFQPQNPLAAFDTLTVGSPAGTYWYLHIQDDLTKRTATGGNVGTGRVVSWSIDVERGQAQTTTDTLVNTTTNGNQFGSSVTMDRSGDFVVTWSGRGQVKPPTFPTNEEDISGSGGVYYQRFNSGGGPKHPYELRANTNTAGDQLLACIGGDAGGHFVISYNDFNPIVPPPPPNTSAVRTFVSRNNVLTPPLTVPAGGPIVSDVLMSNGTRLLDGAALTTAMSISNLVVVFEEEMSTFSTLVPPEPHVNSVLRLENWSLEREGAPITAPIVGVTFEFNNVIIGQFPVTPVLPLPPMDDFVNKWLARINFDGNGLDVGTPPLPPGDYVLTVGDVMKSGTGTTAPTLPANRFLDGDFDGVQGTNLAGTGFPGYKFHFTITAAGSGAEMPVNQNPNREQAFIPDGGIGWAKDETTRSLAVDHDGDFAVVWTSYGQDDPADISGQGAGVYFRLFDRNNAPLATAPNEILVNTTVAGDQRNASVAMDADGDFVVVWEAERQLADGSTDWDIYGRRFNSAGTPLGGEFLVNTNTANDQANAATAMDDFGNFVVVWATGGQDFSYFNNVQAQLFNFRGDRVGSEFRVNLVDLPGSPATGGTEINPAVAMDPVGNFVVTWDAITAQANGVTVNSEVRALTFDRLGNLITPAEILITNPGGGGLEFTRDARNSQVDMDDQGNFVVVFESFADADALALAGTSYGIYGERLDINGTPLGLPGPEVNLVVATGIPTFDDKFAFSQVNPSVAIDADGDYSIVWDGNGAEPHPLDVTGGSTAITSVTDADDRGVWIRSYHPTDVAVTVQSRVNLTQAGVQRTPSIGMERDGDMIVVWSGAGVGDRHGVFFRRYDEATDTAGPLVSDFLAPSGTRIEPAAQVTEPLTHLIVTFDEEMLEQLGNPDSATDPGNYHLLRDGTPVPSYISTIRFGLNQGFVDGILPAATNKWEAVIVLDGNGASPGTPALPNGDYELVLENSLRDVVGNPLGSDANAPDGNSFSRRFNLQTFADGEIRVNADTGQEFTYPHSTQPVASDADGDYVVVWTNEGPGQPGVYAKLYDMQWANVNGQRVSTGPTVIPPINPATGLPWPNNEILVTGDPTATYASVARDVDGDFVVTWSQYDPQTSWDVYARRYNATGDPLSDPFLVNTETENIQQFSSVAMDADGDLVITWQSLEQDGDGWGIYAQRYNPAGMPIGGRNEIQLVNFIGNPTGTFSLSWNGNVTGVINFAGNTFNIAPTIEAELSAIGAEVEVEAVSLSEIAIRFAGAAGSKDQPPISVATQNVTGDPGARVGVSTMVDGDSGEFLVNDTTENHQQFPTIAMDSNGSFVITWTSYGQDGDPAWESNIYARQFPRNEAIRNPNPPSVFSYGASQDRIDGALYLPFVVSVDNPINHEILPDTGLDGVVQVNAGGGMGSGTLLATGTHVLTAAHVVTDIFGGALPGAMVSVNFDLPTGQVVIPAFQVFVHPDYNGDPFLGADVAVIELAAAAPPEVERHDIYRGGDELGRIGHKYGYGSFGTGDVGSVFVPNGIKRGGQNRYDARGSMLSVSDALLAYDFDNGRSENDAFGRLFAIPNLGEGLNEISFAPGDSGGPTFIDGLIATVCTGGVFIPGDHDFIPGLQSSFGDFGVDTRVSIYANWIDEVSVGGEFLVNQTIGHDQKWSSVAMDANGDYVITWTSYGQDIVGTGYGAGAGGLNGVFARRYNFSYDYDYPPSNEFQVNTFTERDQQHSRIAMDADGDFVITWESFQDRPQSPGDDVATSFGIYAQRYARRELLGEIPVIDPITGLPVIDPITGLPVTTMQNEFLGPNGEVGGEMAINTTKDGDQRYPGVAIDDTGDYVIVWSGNGDQPGQVDSQGIFSQRFEMPEDDAGTMVGDVFNVITQGAQIFLGQLVENPVLDTSVTQFVLSFGEDLSLYGGENGAQSALNPFNWLLTKDGVPLAGGVDTISFGLNQAFLSGLVAEPTNKFEAVITFDGDPTLAGAQPLEQGIYTLTVRDEVEDLFDNALDGDFDGRPAGDFDKTFTVYLGLPGPGDSSIPGGPGDPSSEDVDIPISGYISNDHHSPAVAADVDGNYVAVWVTENPVLDAAGLPVLDLNGFPIVQTDIVGQLFDRFGQPGTNQFPVNTYVAGTQIEPDVAMDRFGNFVVTWSGEGDEDDSGVFSRTYDAYAVPQGPQFRVNQFRDSVQDAPRVAMDANGDFVITWTSYGQDGDRDGIFARRYNFRSQPLDDEVQVNGTWVNRQEASDVAVDADGNFVIVWDSFGQDGNSWGVYGQRYDSAGQRLGGEFRINQYSDDKQVYPQVAMDVDGDFVVTWASFLQDGSGYGVYARRFNRAGSVLGNEFRVNQTTLHWQYEPAVSMDDNGDFVITWTSFDQDDDLLDDNGVYARMYNNDGSDYRDPTSGLPLGEWRVNAITEGDQFDSAVAVDSDGDFTVVWVGTVTTVDLLLGTVETSTAVFDRVVAVNPDTYSLDDDPVANGFRAYTGDYTLGGGTNGTTGPVQLTLTGTANDDLFEFIAALMPESWFVRLNGVQQAVDPRTTSIVFDGLGGHDTVLITGAATDDTVELWVDAVHCFGANYVVDATGVEAITVDGQGGSDVAYLNDSPGDDVLVASPTSVTLEGTGYSHTALGFETVHTYAKAGGIDVAQLYDSPGDDTFVFTPQYATLAGDGFFLRAKFFEYAHGYAKNGGDDVAAMYDSAGDDVLVADPTSVRLFGEGHYGRAKFFESVYAFGTAGGVDTASISGSDADEVFVATPAQAEFHGGGFYYYAAGFESVAASGGGGTDAALLYDSPGNDTFITTPEEALLFGPGYQLSATSFDIAHGYAKAGGTDVAYMYDSEGDDTFIGQTTYGKLVGEGFYRRAKFFDFVHAYAKAGGVDTAYLHGSSEDDTLATDGTQTMLYSDTHFNRAKYFEQVYAVGTDGGVDTAIIYNAAVESGEQPAPADISRIAWIYNFEELQLRNSPPGSGDTDVAAVDEIFTLYWE